MPGWDHCSLEVIGFDESPRLEVWGSPEEMLAELESRDTPWVEARSPVPVDRRLETMCVAVTVAGATLALVSQLPRGTNQLVRFDGLPLWYLGSDTHVVAIDMGNLTQVFGHAIRTPFYGLARHSAREILVVAELDLMLIEPDGKEIWRTNVPDIIFNWELLPDALHLTLFDDVPMALDWATGKEIARDTDRPLRSRREE